jgi:hypothetical protein
VGGTLNVREQEGDGASRQLRHGGLRLRDDASGIVPWHRGSLAARRKRDEPVKVVDHAMDALRYVLQAEMGEARRTEVYLAEMQRRVAGMREQE